MSAQLYIVTVVVSVADALTPYARVDGRTGRVCVDPLTGRCEWWSDAASANDDVQNLRPRPPVWCGGDASCAIGSGADPSQTTVESANDGKTAAYHIHQYLQVCCVIAHDSLDESRLYYVCPTRSRNAVFNDFGANRILRVERNRKSERNNLL